MPRATKNTDPIFAEYARTAPLLDLQFYIASANRQAGSLSERSTQIVDAMTALTRDLSGSKPGSLASQKRRVWSLIDRYKASRMPDANVDAVASEALYWSLAPFRRLRDRQKALQANPASHHADLYRRIDLAARWAMLGSLFLDPNRLRQSATVLTMPVRDDQAVSDTSPAPVVDFDAVSGF